MDSGKCVDVVIKILAFGVGINDFKDQLSMRLDQFPYPSLNFITCESGIMEMVVVLVSFPLL